MDSAIAKGSLALQNCSSYSWVEVDLSNLLRNAQTIAETARGARLLPVVKANAYGLGLIPVAKALESVNPWGFAVATVEEGAALRESGIRRPVLVLRPANLKMQESYNRWALTAVIDDPLVALEWLGSFHIEVDTGMGRTGVRWDATNALAAVGSRKPDGAFTHFHSADSAPESVAVQWSRFRHALTAMQYRPPLLHIANSAGICLSPEQLEIVRPGIFLYGGMPSDALPSPVPVVSLRARVVSVRRILAGESVSYGTDWHAVRDTWIATLAIGYADGVPRAWSDRGSVLIRGRRCPSAGRVTMDMVMVDVGPEEESVPRVGDVATLIGDDGGEMISLDQCAAWSNTISYEILTRLGNRLPRLYLP